MFEIPNIKTTNLNESNKSKGNSKKVSSKKIRPLASSGGKIFIRNNKPKLTLENKKESQTSKITSFSPYYQSKNSIKFKEEIKNFGSNNETTLSSSNFSNFHNNLSNRTIVNYKKNFTAFSRDKKEDSQPSRNVKKNKLLKNSILSTEKPSSFNLRDYKRNLYFKCGFFVNEIIKLGLGPNIPLRKEIMFLNEDE